jgi:hypothetical protein
VRGLLLSRESESASAFRAKQKSWSTCDCVFAVDSFTGLNLRRVLVAPKGFNHEDVKVLAIELYDDGLIVRWVCPGLELPVPDFADSDTATVETFDLPSFEVRDDVGTRYRIEGASGGDAVGAVRGESVYVPAIPAEARKLTVVTGARSVELNL